MSDVATNIYDWSTTASSNLPSDSTTIGAGLADNFQAIQSVVRAAFASKGADIASATTTDIGAVAGLAHDITGTTTITSLGTVSAGIWKILQFDGALTLTHNGTSLILPGAVNITTAAGDVGVFISEGSGNWRCVSYSGKNIAGNNLVLTGDLAVNGGDLTTSATTFNLLNTTATTVNFAGGASTALNIGHASGTNTVRGATTLSSSLTLSKASGVADQLLITDTSNGAGITIGGDANLYRTSANVLATDDMLRFGNDKGIQFNGTANYIYGSSSTGVLTLASTTGVTVTGALGVATRAYVGADLSSASLPTFVISSTVSGAQVSSGTTQTNGVLRIASSSSTGCVDMGIAGSINWIQSTDRTSLGSLYTLALNPNGGGVTCGGTLGVTGAMTAQSLKIDTNNQSIAGVTTAAAVKSIIKINASDKVAIDEDALGVTIGGAAVSYGANDSGGAGFKVMRVPN